MDPLRRRILQWAASAGLLSLAGCSSGESTETATPTPVNEIPYTAADPEQNVALHRVLTIENNADRDYALELSLTDTDGGETFFRRRVTVEADSRQQFHDLMSKKGVYLARFEFDVGVSKEYEWPVDDEHGNGSLAILTGDTPSNPVVFFSIQQL